MAVYLDPTHYYRLPWSLTDNGISWLEPTWKCNIYCDGCPDMTVLDGKLVWSCRAEEPMQFGRFLQTVPKQARAELH